MAQTARMEADDIPLIEEQVDTGLDELLRAYRPNFTPGGEKKDELAKRFRLFPNKPIPEMNHAYAKAFAAEDNFNTQRAVYAMVLETSIPYRHRALTELVGFNHPSMVSLLGAGTVNCSHLNESRMVMFFERPSGKSLAEILKATPRLHEHRITDFVLTPAAKALIALRDGEKISHGNICPASLFLGETPMLGECSSLPCGMLGSHFYQPMEMLLADPLGRGEANEKMDVYALGVTALEAIYGIDHLKNVSRENLIRMYLERGSFQTLTYARNFSDTYEDLFRGTLHDDPIERWDLNQLNQWLGGKRFNMIAPTSSKDAQHPIAFAGDDYLSVRVIANAFHRQWRTALKDIRGLKLDRWIAGKLRNQEMATSIDRLLRMTSENAPEAQANDMLTRIISVLDPIGPIRGQSFSLRPDGIGAVLADLMQHQSTAELAQLAALIEADTSAFWEELAEESNKSNEQTQLIGRLQHVRLFMKMEYCGFGIERVLYDLNPSLPCQSSLVRKYHVTDLPDLLKTLDALAVNFAADTAFTDSHIAAFVTSKINLNKEIRLHDLVTLPALSKNKELIVLTLLATAQKKHPSQLVGLCAWAAMRIEKMLDQIHNREVRKDIKLNLKRLASTGSLDMVLRALVNRNLAIRDYEGFAHAIALHQINTNKIERFRNPRLTDYYARDMGGKFSVMIGYFVLMITSYITLTKVLGI